MRNLQSESDYRLFDAMGHNAEKRKATRRKSFLRALVYFDGAASPVECLIRDISEAGARLRLPDLHTRAGALSLFIPSNGKKFKGTIRWQHEDEIGILFDTPGAASHADESREKRKSSNADISVLIVDDSSTVTRVITDYLKNLGFTDVASAQDGQSALDRLSSEQKYGLIISDWEMEPMSGEEFLTQIRYDKRIGKIPIILATAKAGRGSAWLVGATAYVRKPFSQGDLQAAIERAFFLH